MRSYIIHTVFWDYPVQPLVLISPEPVWAGSWNSTGGLVQECPFLWLKIPYLIHNHTLSTRVALTDNAHTFFRILYWIPVVDLSGDCGSWKSIGDLKECNRATRCKIQLYSYTVGNQLQIWSIFTSWVKLGC